MEFTVKGVGNAAHSVPQIFSTSMGENISILHLFRTKSAQQGLILLRSAEGSAPYVRTRESAKQQFTIP
ncbi:MAG: hypothetical protein IJY91_06695, partial [Oscillospiraceae bacterium]|nr:hypothetical protein [Oscillospiraceae bacterium]